MRTALPALLLLLAACNEPAPPTPTRPFAQRLPDGRGLENVAQITPTLYRGAQPTKEGFARLKELGIKTVINLRSNHDDQDEAAGSGIELVDLPMHADVVGSTAPSEEDVKRFFEIVLDPARQPVYFHCAHGKDRTGTMAALWRIERDGWTADEAIAEMHHFGYHTIYEDLINFVKTYKPRGYGKK
jgi:protein tyrosine/serine phosphatase